MDGFQTLLDWAASLPQGETPPSPNPETLSYAVPFKLGDAPGEAAAKTLARAYLRSALEDVAALGPLALMAPLQESVVQVERRETNFWARVVRSGWAYYRVWCRVSLPSEAVAHERPPFLGQNASKGIDHGRPDPL